MLVPIFVQIQIYSQFLEGDLISAEDEAAEPQAILTKIRTLGTACSFIAFSSHSYGLSASAWSTTFIH